MAINYQVTKIIEKEKENENEKENEKENENENEKENEKEEEEENIKHQTIILFSRVKPLEYNDITSLYTSITRYLIHFFSEREDEKN
jgi:hypothetical protein